MKPIKIDALQCRSFAKMIAWLTVALVTAGLPVGPARGGEPDTAQWLLFDNPYLAAISPPAQLAYRFEHSTADEKTYGKSFTDDIKIDVDPPDENHTLNNVTLDIFTDSQNRRIGPLSDVRGNPVVMVFLERAVFQMKRHVPGSLAYLRNIIRKAMRENASVENVDIDFGSETVAAKRITIVPFDDEKNPQQFSKFGKKAYHFTVSQAVPGGIFEIVSFLPNPNHQDEALILDRVVFTSTSGK